MERSIESHWLGQKTYLEAEHLQNHYQEQAKTTGRGYLLGVEHPSVVTLGVRAQPDTDIKASEAQLKEHLVEVVSIQRGGEATLHSPGQLVIYPILPLKAWGWGVRFYVEGLHQVSHQWLEKMGILTQRRNCPGLYTNTGKLVFFGIRVQRGVSKHGLSINVSNDLDLFSLIRSCGQEQEKFDQIARYKHINASLKELFSEWVQEFTQTYDLTKSGPSA